MSEEPGTPSHPPGSAPAELAKTIAEALTASAATLALAETSAGGLASAFLTAVPGSSAWFLGGVVAYSASAKETWLGLTPEAVRKTGAVSAEGALALARAVRRSLGATWGAAETGIAGPQTGRRSAKPVGLCCVAVSGGPPGAPIESVVELQTGLDDRESNRLSFAAALLRTLVASLQTGS